MWWPVVEVDGGDASSLGIRLQGVAVVGVVGLVVQVAAGDAGGRGISGPGHAGGLMVGVGQPVFENKACRRSNVRSVCDQEFFRIAISVTPLC